MIRFVIDLFYGPAFHVEFSYVFDRYKNVLLLFHMYLLKLDCFSPERKVDARKERERDTLCLQAVTIPLMGTRFHHPVMFLRPLTNVYNLGKN